ncbi:MAG: tetratricopeptide repeat protein [Blastocatellia bacterium]|nr:tetratricopeptide repeat protein [Blastocatellia bacterium]
MRTRTALILVLACFLLLYPLQNAIDQRRPKEDVIEQVLYLPSGQVVKAVSFGFDGILADIYWLRSVQYFGRQLLDEKGEFNWSRINLVRYDLLYPLLDITTTLDPNYIAAYRFGAIFLPDYNHQQALSLLQKGIANNPNNWRLYQHLAMIYWQHNDYKLASETFLKGGDIPTAPAWMKVMGGVMLTQGGDRKVACALYGTLYKEALESNDQYVSSQMESQIRRVHAIDEVDYLNKLIEKYKQAKGTCPNNLADLGPLLGLVSQEKGACGQSVTIQLNEKREPISPLGTVYRFDPKECKAKMPFDLYEPWAN